jgi:hypothetical protein
MKKPVANLTPTPLLEERDNAKTLAKISAENRVCEIEILFRTRAMIIE